MQWSYLRERDAMAYLVLIGTGGWTQRWEICAGQESVTADALKRIGTDETGVLTLLDPNTATEISFVVAWAAVAAGCIVPSPADLDAPGQYA